MPKPAIATRSMSRDLSASVSSVVKPSRSNVVANPPNSSRETSNVSMPAPNGDVETATGPVRRDERDVESGARPSLRGWCPYPDTKYAEANVRPTRYERLDDLAHFLARFGGVLSRRCTPAAASASILACAVPLDPEMMAPAWPILRPGGAVTPAM